MRSTARRVPRRARLAMLLFVVPMLFLSDAFHVGDDPNEGVRPAVRTSDELETPVGAPDLDERAFDNINHRANLRKTESHVPN